MDERLLFDALRDADTIRALARQINALAPLLPAPLAIMEVCGGHTHAIMKYGLPQLLPPEISFVHGPGCPVCVMPKERVDSACVLARQEGVILVTLGDMIKVPGSAGSLADVRAEGADVRFVYSPSDVLPLALAHPDKKVVFFAIGFETTTPMTAALLEQAKAQGVRNLLVLSNHVTVPEPMRLLLESHECRIDAFIGPSHVSVIAGAKIYEPFVREFGRPVVVAGFEPVDVLHGVWMLVKQKVEGRCALEVQYTRSVTHEGNAKAQALIGRVFEKREHFRWRGLGDIPWSALKLRDAFAEWDAEQVYASFLPQAPVEDHPHCLCGAILRGVAMPTECRLFGTACTPQNPLGSCMVSSEGACAAYYRYRRKHA